MLHYTLIVFSFEILQQLQETKKQITPCLLNQHAFLLIQET